MMMGREKVRVARALPDLPLIDKAFSEGKISYTKVRAMTRVATPENEQFLLQIAEYGTANHMEFLVRKYRYCKRLQEPGESENWKRYKDLHCYQDETGMYVINARLPPEEGALVVRALEIIQVENRRKKEEVKETVIEEIGVKVDSNNVSAETFSQGMSKEDFLADDLALFPGLCPMPCKYVMVVVFIPPAARITTLTLTILNTGWKAAKLTWRTW